MKDKPIHEILSEEELAELLSPAVEEFLPVSSSSESMSQNRREFAASYWEQIVRDLQKEVQDLRNRVELLEKQPKDGFGGDIPSPIVTLAEPNEIPELQVSRTAKHKRSSWF
ncbi:hypothetical protein [Cohnella sp.]|uniref:hypothetical protein n=1 Tax=Cohnella sp. TaxID=1883426 RepID=UPI003561C28C